MLTTDVEEWCNSTFGDYEPLYSLRESTLMRTHYVLVWLSFLFNAAGSAVILQHQNIIKKYIYNIFLTLGFYTNEVLFLQICYCKTDVKSKFLFNRTLRFNGSTQATVMVLVVVEKLISISPLLQSVFCEIRILRKVCLLAMTGVVHVICTVFVPAQVHFKIGITVILLIVGLFVLSTKKLIKAYRRPCEFLYLLWTICSFSSLCSIAFVVTAMNNDYCPIKGTPLMQVSLLLYSTTFLSNPIAFYLKIETERDKYTTDYDTIESFKLSAQKIETKTPSETESSEPMMKLIYLDRFNDPRCKREDVIDFTDNQPSKQCSTILSI